MLSSHIVKKNFTSSDFCASKNELCENYINLVRKDSKSDIDCRILQLLEDEIELYT